MGRAAVVVSGWPALIAAASALGGAGWAAQGGGPGAYRALWWTAGCSTTCFLGALVTSDAGWRSWWRGFAASHAVHLAAIAWFALGLGGHVTAAGVGAGGLAYLGLAAATWRESRSGLGRHDPLVRVATPYLWFVFVLTYTLHAVASGGPHRWVALAALVAVPAYRAVGRRDLVAPAAVG